MALRMNQETPCCLWGMGVSVVICEGERRPGIRGNGTYEGEDGVEVVGEGFVL